jgi:hypothetical protein
MLKSNSLKMALSASVVAASLLTTAFAGDKETKVIEETKKSAITGDFGVGFVSAYYSRGIRLENTGLIAQPYANLYFNLYEGTGLVNKVSLNLGIWSSLHSQQPNNGSTTGAWYEFDYTPGVSVTFANDFTLTSTYFEFTSPNDSFSTFRGANFTLAYNDSALLGAFALKPYVTYLQAIEGAAGINALSVGSQYYEIGVTPGLPAFGPVSVSFPIKAGFGSNGFYAGNGFGYASAGPAVAVALPVPAAYGSWTATAGVTGYALGPNTAKVDGDNDFDVVYSAGIGAAF